MTQLEKRVKVENIEYVTDFCLRFFFEDGSTKEIDLDKYLHGPIFEAIRNDMQQFHAYQVAGGTITWPNGADIDPDVLYYDLTPAWMETPEKA